MAGTGGGLVGELEVAPASRISRRDEAPIEPVRVGLVALSGVGRRGKGKANESAGAEWLATVDSRADAEVYLKLWKWGVGSGSGSSSTVTASTSAAAPNAASATTTTTGSNLCTLNTRIDRPHGDNRVTSLEFHPAGAEVLATTGEDGLVKMWGVRRDQREGALFQLFVPSLVHRAESFYDSFRPICLFCVPIMTLTTPFYRVLGMHLLLQLPKPHPK